MTTAERVKGYRAALKDYGVPYDPALVQEDNFGKPQPHLMTERLLALPNPPTAILTSGDPEAFRVMEILREHGLRIPEDISVIGFDDIPQASLVYPKLTTVHQPLYEMGKVAAQMLLERIEDPDLPPQHVQLETRLVIRDSCCPPQSLLPDERQSNDTSPEQSSEYTFGKPLPRRTRRRP